MANNKTSNFQANDPKDLGKFICTIADEKRLTLTQFAEKLGISYSTLYRIIQGDSSGSQSLIDTICEQLPSPCSVSAEDLRKAYLTSRFSKRSSLKTTLASQNGAGKPVMKDAISKAVIDSLVNRGFFVQNIVSHVGQFRMDTTIGTNALSPETNEIHSWAFEFMLNDDYPYTATSTEMFLRKLLQLIGAIRFFGGEKPEKISFVVADKEVFNHCIEVTEKGQSLDEFISIIFVNLDSKEITEHFLASEKHGNLPLISPFSSPVSTKKDEEFYL